MNLRYFCMMILMVSMPLLAGCRSMTSDGSPNGDWSSLVERLAAERTSHEEFAGRIKQKLAAGFEPPGNPQQKYERLVLAYEECIAAVCQDLRSGNTRESTVSLYEKADDESIELTCWDLSIADSFSRGLDLKLRRSLGGGDYLFMSYPRFVREIPSIRQSRREQYANQLQERTMKQWNAIPPHR